MRLVPALSSKKARLEPAGEFVLSSRRLPRGRPPLLEPEARAAGVAQTGTAVSGENAQAGFSAQPDPGLRNENEILAFARADTALVSMRSHRGTRKTGR